MTNREWLCRGFKLAIEIRELEIAYNTALGEADYISPSFADRVQTGQSNGVENKNVRAVELQGVLFKAIEKKRCIVLEITKAIEDIADNKVRAVLYARYINCKTIELIAVEQNISYRWVQKMIRRGEAMIKYIK